MTPLITFYFLQLKSRIFGAPGSPPSRPTTALLIIFIILYEDNTIAICISHKFKNIGRASGKEVGILLCLSPSPHTESRSCIHSKSRANLYSCMLLSNLEIHL